ncbi:MAG: transcriptional regulator [Actinomycetota bacterium]
MRIASAFTDAAVLGELGRRIERTRLERNLSQAALADVAAVGLNTLRRLEGGQGSTLVNLIRVLRALDLLEGLDRLVPEPAPSPIQQLRLAGRRRRRASGRRGEVGEGPPPGAASGWRWGDEEPR